MNDAALHTVRVLDLTDSIAGQYCARLLADYGAEVVLAEPPDGTPMRQAAPLADGREPPENSLLFQHLNGGKRSIMLDRHDPADRERIEQLGRDADIIIAELADAAWARTLVGERSILCVVSDFGATGPYRDWQGCELIHQALAGVMYTTGLPDREPLYGVGNRASYACAVTAYSSILAALFERERSGRGQEVEAVTAEAAAAMGQNLLVQYGYSRVYPTRRAYPGMLGQLECADGWLILFALRGWPHLCTVFGIPEYADDPRFANPAGLRAHWPEALELLRPKARTRLGSELVELLQNGKISSARALTLRELVQHEHFRAREFMRQANDGDTTIHALGPVFRTQSPCRQQLLAPRLNADADFSWTARSQPKLPAVAEDRAPPLANIRVLDFTTAWAGPMTARSLGFLGADVIKVENAKRLDSWRGPVVGMGDPAVYPDSDGGAQPYNLHSWFHNQNHDKRSVAIDLKEPRGRDLAKALAATCDVVVANYSPRALDKLGLGYDVLSADHPELVMVEMPAFGNSGPWSRHVGMGKTMEAAAGMASLIGYGDGEPTLTGPAYLDPIGGLHGVAATLTALVERARTGRGQYVEVAQVEAAMHWIGEYIVETLTDGRVFEPTGNALRAATPHNAYPCAGEDEWITIAALTDGAWHALIRVGGIAELDNADYADAASRYDRRHEIDHLLASWTRTQAKWDLAHRLQAAGIHAAPVSNGMDVYRDAALRTRGLVHEVTHPLVGKREYTAPAYRLSRTPGRMSRPAPMFAQHLDEVFGTLVGLNADAIDDFVAQGVLHRTPVVA